MCRIWYPHLQLFHVLGGGACALSHGQDHDGASQDDKSAQNTSKYDVGHLRMVIDAHTVACKVAVDITAGARSFSLAGHSTSWSGQTSRLGNCSTCSTSRNMKRGRVECKIEPYQEPFPTKTKSVVIPRQRSRRLLAKSL